jgi:hypothetical protein
MMFESCLVGADVGSHSRSNLSALNWFLAASMRLSSSGLIGPSLSNAMLTPTTAEIGICCFQKIQVQPRAAAATS